MTDTSTKTQLYRCARPGCGAVLGLLLADGRLQVPANGVASVCLVEGVIECIHGHRNGFDRQRRAEVVPAFVDKHYPNGLDTAT